MKDRKGGRKTQQRERNNQGAYYDCQCVSPARVSRVSHLMNGGTGSVTPPAGALGSRSPETSGAVWRTPEVYSTSRKHVHTAVPRGDDVGTGSSKQAEVVGTRPASVSLLTRATGGSDPPPLPPTNNTQYSKTVLHNIVGYWVD